MKILRYLLLGLVLVMVGMVSFLTAVRFAIHGREAVVPKLVGMTPQEAARACQAQDLLFEVESQYYSAEIPASRIMSQLPEPGTRVRRGWRVRASQSLGPQHTTIPSVVGQSSRAAELNLMQRGLEVGTVAVAAIPNAGSGEVVAQDPPAEAQGVASPKVSLLVSTPEEALALIMPDLTGRGILDAQRAVQDAGLKVGNITLVGRPANESGTPPEGAQPAATQGVVVRQDPAPGQKVLVGAMVHFQVAQ